KGVQNVNSFRELRQVEDPMFRGGTNPQLVDPGAHAGHGLPVIRLQPLLDQVELVTGETSRVIREGSPVLEAGACPEARVHRQQGVYSFLYGRAQASRLDSARISPAQILRPDRCRSDQPSDRARVTGRRTWTGGVFGRCRSGGILQA